jgi:hypothetical protein
MEQAVGEKEEVSEVSSNSVTSEHKEFLIVDLCWGGRVVKAHAC